MADLPKQTHHELSVAISDRIWPFFACNNEIQHQICVQWNIIIPTHDKIPLNKNKMNCSPFVKAPAEIFSFDTDLWWRAGGLAEAVGSSLAGCTTNAKTTEEPTSIIMKTSVRDMAQKLGDWSCRVADLAADGRCGGFTSGWCYQRYYWPGPGNLGFYLPVPPCLALRYLTLLSCPLWTNTRRMIWQGKGSVKDTGCRASDGSHMAEHRSHEVIWNLPTTLIFDELHWWSKSSCVPLCTETFIWKDNTASLCSC